MKTMDDRIILENDSKSHDERDLPDNKPIRDTNSDNGDFLCGCDSGKCFDCGI
jgi:hypothetical protein